MEQSNIIIKSKNGKKHEISLKAVKLSKYIDKIISDNPSQKEIVIDNIEDKILKKVIEYLKHYDGNPPSEIEKPLPKGDVKQILINAFDNDNYPTKFLDKLSVDDLMNVTEASDILDIEPLLDLCCFKIASFCKDGNDQDILRNFGITKNFKDEQREDLTEENEYTNEADL